MKVSDYIVSFLADLGVTHVFGYPGGMVTHLMDSFDKASSRIRAHVCYHEQAAAFAACGYAQTSGVPGVAYATSGPGATNLVTGIANAYFDSIPVIFLTGQVNTYESKGGRPIRQRGFQEMDVVALTASITKYSVQVSDEADIRYHLEKAVWAATEGRPGPVVLDIPMNIQRMDVESSSLREFAPPPSASPLPEMAAMLLIDALSVAKRPCIVAGAGVAACGMADTFRDLIEKWQIPVVSSMLAVDILPGSTYYFGFIGAYGMRHANWILEKSDLIIALGTRLDLRQIGIDRAAFAERAQLIRVDIDPTELAYEGKAGEMTLRADLRSLLPWLEQQDRPPVGTVRWLGVCEDLRSRLQGVDDKQPNHMVAALGGLVPTAAVVTTDVGQNQVWVAQSFPARGQRILFSGGHGAMGYSLPAAIGASYGSGGTVYCFTGDGGLQMNLQELQFLAREQISVKVILLNNRALGMIRHFQEMYFEGNCVQTRAEKGYTTPDFSALAHAFSLPYTRVQNIEALDAAMLLFEADGPAFIEVTLPNTTYVFPKSSVSKPLWDQEPPLEDELIAEFRKM